MAMDLLALLIFIAAIILAFVRHVNIGIVALAVGAVSIRIFGLADKNLISGISSSMFCTLVGITLLFAVIKKPVHWIYWRRKLLHQRASEFGFFLSPCILPALLLPGLALALYRL